MNITLDATGDIDFSTGNLVLLSGIEEVAQKLTSRYRFFQGEWFLDQRLGVPWFQTIFVKGTNENLIKNKLRKVTTDCPGISQLTSFEVEIDAANRVWTVTLTALLDTGDILESFTVEMIL